MADVIDLDEYRKCRGTSKVVEQEKPADIIHLPFDKTTLVKLPCPTAYEMREDKSFKVDPRFFTHSGRRTHTDTGTLIQNSMDTSVKVPSHDTEGEYISRHAQPDAWDRLLRAIYNPSAIDD